MLPFFPEPYPDELLYSVLARYHRWSRNTNYRQTLEDIYGSQTMRVARGFSNSLRELCNNISINSSITPEYLIKKYTLLPFYKPFLPINRAHMLENEMIGNSSNRIHGFLGSMASSIPSIEKLRFCPRCFELDKHQYGESYWHRVHQIFGVYICPHHKIPLQNTELMFSTNTQEFITLDQITEFKLFEPLNELGDLSLKHYTLIADQVLWLLSNNVNSVGLDVIKDRYIRIFQKNGLATPAGHIRLKKLTIAFNNHYSSELLAKLSSSVDYEKSNNWLTKLLRKPRISIHPLRHILLINFMGLTVEDFLMNDHFAGPFGTGPWPCLNPASTHYRELVIEHCSVTRDYDSGCPVGTFFCSCGFEYSRRGPDLNKEDIYKIGRIKSFGPIWHEALIQVNNQDLSLREKARILHVDPKTVINQLRKLHDEKNVVKVIEKAHDDFYLTREKYRLKWEEKRKMYPEKTKNELRVLQKGVFTWLYRHDRNWLIQDSPLPMERQRYEDKRVEWGQRDEELVEKVIDAAQKIKDMEGKPKRITIAAIGREIGNLSLLQKKLDRLPKTKSAIDSVIETVEDFQIRRVQFVVKELKKDHSGLPLWLIEREAGLRPGYSEKVKNKILHLLTTSNLGI